MRLSLLSWITLALALSGCAGTRVSVTRTAAIASEPWRCPEEATRVDQVGYGRYQLAGCNQTAVYACNFALQPPRCSLQR